MRLMSGIAAAAAIAVVAVSVQAASLTIEQSGQHFSQRSVTVGAGDTIVFVNQDDVTHNIHVIDKDDDAADLGLQKSGETLSYQFDASGRFQVRCSIHPSMKLTVDVR
jgi:plastocyanin